MHHRDRGDDVPRTRGSATSRLSRAGPSHVRRTYVMIMRTRRFVSRQSQHALASLRTTGAIALVTITAAGCAAGHASSSTTARDPDRREWIELFNGRNLDGWT